MAKAKRTEESDVETAAKAAPQSEQIDAVLTPEEREAAARSHLIELLRQFRVAMLVTHDGQDGLRGRPMAIAEVDEAADLWFVTSAQTEKAEEIRQDGGVAVVMQSAMASLSVDGTARVVKDPERVRKLWSEAWRVWFPKGPDESDLVLVHVKTARGEYWDQRGAKGVRYLVASALAYLRGTRPRAEEPEQHAQADLGGKVTARKSEKGEPEPKIEKEGSAVTAELQTWFDAFAKALTAGNGTAIAKMWTVPAFVVGDEMERVVKTKKEIAEFFGGAKAEYDKLGVTDTRAEIQRVQPLTERMVAVDVRWPYVKADGTEAGSERSTYLLRRDDKGALKMCFVAMKGQD